MTRNTTRLPFLSTLLAATLLMIQACSGSGEERPSPRGEGIQIQDAWARPASEGRMSAVYLTIQAGGTSADTLMDASSDVASLVEIHESYESEDGLMGMRHIESVPVPAGSTVALEQGGLHIMLIQLQHDISEGERVPLTLHFARTGEIELDVPVGSPDTP